MEIVKLPSHPTYIPHGTVAVLLQHLAQSALTTNHLTQQDLCRYTLKRGPKPERKTAWHHIYSKENYMVKQPWLWTSNWIGIENRQQLKPRPNRHSIYWEVIDQKSVDRWKKMQGGYSHQVNLWTETDLTSHDKVLNIHDDNWTASTGKDNIESSSGPWAKVSSKQEKHRSRSIQYNSDYLDLRAVKKLSYKTSICHLDLKSLTYRVTVWHAKRAEQRPPYRQCVVSYPAPLQCCCQGLSLFLFPLVSSQEKTRGKQIQDGEDM